MAVSLNAFVGFNSTANYQNVPRMGIGASLQKAKQFSPSSRMFVSSRPVKVKTGRPCLLVANVDRLATETSNESSENAESSFPGGSSSTSPENKLGDQTSEPSNGSMVSSSPKQDIKTTPKLKLTAREKLKAARVLSRYPASKPSSTPQLGSKVLEVLRESDKGKRRSGLPEAPTNLFDDSKRGMPKKGLTFELPVGWDVFLIIVSVVFISTVMFTTTYIVWKVGAIHFNEY